MAVGSGVLEMAVMVGSGRHQEDENADYEAGDGGRVQEGGDANLG